MRGWSNPKAEIGVTDPVEKGRFAACLRCFFSNAWADVSHEVSVDPVDDAGIEVSHLEQSWNLWVPGTAIDPNHICRAPATFRVSAITVMPALTCRKTGSDLGAATALA